MQAKLKAGIFTNGNELSSYNHMVEKVGSAEIFYLASVLRGRMDHAVRDKRASLIGEFG